MKKITNLEFGSLVYFITRSYFVGISLNSLLIISQQDSWISILIGFIIGIIPLLAFIYIQNYEPSLNINEKNIKLFGKTFGNIINIILGIFTFMMIAISFSNITTIIHGDYLSKTPVSFLAVAFGIAVFYSTLKGLKSICRASLIFFYLSIIFVIASESVLLIQTDFNNLKPILYNGTNIFKGGISYMIFNILPLYILNIIPKSQIKDSNKSWKYMIIFYIIGNITLFLVTYCIIGIFGIKLANLYQYPEFQILKHVAVIGLSSRLDSILFIKWIIDILIFIILGLYYTVKTTHLFINEKKNICLFIYCLILIIIPIFIPNNLFFNLISIKFLPIIFPIILITIFLLIVFKIKYSKKVQNKN